MPRGDARRRRQSNAKKAWDEKHHVAGVTIDKVKGDGMSASMRRFMSLKAAAAGGAEGERKGPRNPRAKDAPKPPPKVDAAAAEAGPRKPTPAPATAPKAASAVSTGRKEKAKQRAKERKQAKLDRKLEVLDDPEEILKLRARLNAPRFGEQAQAPIELPKLRKVIK